MKTRIIAAALAAFAPAAFAGLPTGLTGTWFNPAQSGHGVLLEMLSPDSAIGAWNVFDAAGNPMHLYLEGHVEDDRLVLQAYAPRGMKFGSFDRGGFSAPRWGTLTLDFTDCDHATMSYNGDGAAGAGFGQGTIPLQRLTRIAGLSCDFTDELTQVPAGAYDGDWGWPAHFTGDEFRVAAAVDTDGRLWATSAWTPGVTYISAAGYSPVLIATAPVSTPTGFEAAMTARYNTAVTRGRTDVPGGPVLTSVQYRSDAAGTVTARSAGAPNTFTDLAVSRVAGANALDDPGFDSDSLDGRRFTFLARGQFFDFTRTIEFGGNYPNAGDDHICIVHDTVANACEFQGRITASDEGYAMFDFVLNHSFDPGRVYRGKGWVRSDTGELVLVAEGGERGFGVVAQPKN